MDSIQEAKHKILSGIESKRRSVRRKWMEINSLANAHQLLLLPYHAMLTHAGLLIEQRNATLHDDDHVPSSQPNNDEEPACSCVVCTTNANVERDGEDEYMEFASTLNTTNVDSSMAS